MEKIKDSAPEGIKTENEKKAGFPGGLLAAIKNSFSGGREGTVAPVYDATVFALSFIFARCHLIFGAYPIAIGAIAVLPSRVWFAVLGSVAGALTLGSEGIIYAMISVIVAFLRVIISATDKHTRDEGTPSLFGEGILLRMSSALIGGFIVAVYEILLNSFTTESALFGASMVILPPLVTFSLSGLFDAGISPSAIFLDNTDVFSARGASKSDERSLIFFKCSALFGIFLISISLGAYELIGVSVGFVFAGLITLFTSRRFGALYGAVVGFASSVGLSGIYSVAFMLVGIVAGALSSLGMISAAILGGVALSAWGGYIDGTVGFLTVFPEYAIAAALAIPLFKKTKLERTKEEVASAQSIAEDMVGTMALSYKSKYTGALDTLESSFASLSTVSRSARERDTEIRTDELKRLATECITRYFDSEGAHIPGGDEAKLAFTERIDSIIPILKGGKKLVKEDFGTPVHLSLIASGITEAINRAVGIVSEERYRERAHDTSAEDFEYVSKLINEARCADSEEKSANDRLREATEAALCEMGLSGYAVQVYGERSPHFIIATEDESGSTVSSPALRHAIEDAAGVTLGTPEYYRKGNMALMECHATASYSASTYSAGAAMTDEISGDTTREFETQELRYYALISDGMGSGEDAVRTSGFVADYLSHTLEFGRGTETALRLVNNILKRRRTECSATVDLFTVDLINGEAMFYKCGAAPSYVKRGSSLFRIRSRTSPIGLSPELDCERIRVELESGDFIIMFSDGVSSDGEAPWLVDVIARPGLNTPEAIGSAILTAAKKHGAADDDISVSVTVVKRIKRE
ncbi:MAG: SpoIIE family protein phosphatase [Clostridia bacterium]|nr:SpoIIE family protein phosphatase [Clostridia bacterium]